MKKILVTGGCGYVGSRLVPYLLSKGYDITVLDSLIYGNNLEKFHFKLIEGDIRDKDILKKSMKGIDTIVHLAAISNDPTAELKPEITKEINYDSIINMVNIAKEENINRIVLASSSTLYGYQGEDKILKEDDEIFPLTLYGKYKAESEKAAFDMADDKLTITAARPGTVAGFSLRQRFDLIVNIFANNALINNKIRIDGGKQKRPIIHIEDMCRAYEYLITAPYEKVQKQAFNIVGENMNIEEIAKVVLKTLPGTESYYVDVNDDRRSYFTSSEKIENILNFKPKFTSVDAIKEIKDKYDEGFYEDSLNNINYFNIKKLKSLGN